MTFTYYALNVLLNSIKSICENINFIYLFIFLRTLILKCYRRLDDKINYLLEGLALFKKKWLPKLGGTKEKQLNKLHSPHCCLLPKSGLTLRPHGLQRTVPPCPSPSQSLPKFMSVMLSNCHSPQFVSNLSSFFVLTIVSVQRRVRE